MTAQPEEFGKPELKNGIGSSTSCFELFLELYSTRDPPLATDTLFLFSRQHPSEGSHIGVNESVTKIVQFEHAQ